VQIMIIRSASVSDDYGLGISAVKGERNLVSCMALTDQPSNQLGLVYLTTLSVVKTI
jgi:hypothetical protein